MPAIRSDTLLCLPPASIWPRGAYYGERVYGDYYVVDRVRTVNYELLDYVASSELEEKAAVRAFVDSKKDSISTIRSVSDSKIVSDRSIYSSLLLIGCCQARNCLEEQNSSQESSVRPASSSRELMYPC